MDSIKRYAPEWHLFDNGRLPLGHFHSTPVQLLVERGLPALILWLIVLAVYLRTLWRGFYNERAKAIPSQFFPSGLLLGCLGGTVGFIASSVVHYNLGDQEVAMVFFLLMGLSMRIVQTAHESDVRSAQEMTAHSDIQAAA